MISMRSKGDAMEMLDKAKDLIESAHEMMENACEMLKSEMSERSGMGYRNQSRDSRGRYSSRDWNERTMRREDWREDDMPRGRYGY